LRKVLEGRLEKERGVEWSPQPLTD